jgi:hypothetical protein
MIVDTQLKYQKSIKNLDIFHKLIFKKDYFKPLTGKRTMNLGGRNINNQHQQ